jgi:hypothetical protein
MVGCREIGQRIAAKDGRFARIIVRINEQSQNYKLARLEERKRLPIDGRKNEGSYAIAFLINTSDPHLSKAGPCGRLFLIGEPRIPRRSFGTRILLEHCLERTLPALAKRGNAQSALELIARVSGQIQEGVNVGHGDALGTASNFYDVIARANFPFLQHAKVESWPVMFYEQRRHTRLVHADADAEARHARLRYFKYRATDAVSIADADLVIGKSLDGEVFSELAVDEVVTPEKAFPVAIGAHLVDENGALFPAVTGEIGLRISINIELARRSPSINWGFPD